MAIISQINQRCNLPIVHEPILNSLASKWIVDIKILYQGYHQTAVESFALGGVEV